MLIKRRQWHPSVDVHREERGDEGPTQKYGRDRRYEDVWADARAEKMNKVCIRRGNRITHFHSRRTLLCQVIHVNIASVLQFVY